MPLTIIHGDHHVHSRKKLQDIIDNTRTNNQTIFRFEAKSLDLLTLEQSLGVQQLFSQMNDYLIVIEGLLGLPRSKKKTQFIEFIQKSLPTAHHLVLWEKKQATATQLKSFPTATVNCYPVSDATFKWLDQIHSTNTQLKLRAINEAIKQDDPDFCFAMLTRQIRLLLTACSGGVVKGHPFVIKKIHQQANSFSTAELLAYHSKLVELDFQRKTGQLSSSFELALTQLMI